MSKNNSRLKLVFGICGVALLAAAALFWPFGPARAACSDGIKDNVGVSVNNVPVDEPANAPVDEPKTDEPKTDQAIPAGAQILLDVYPDCIKGYQNGNLVMADGTTITYDDKKDKSFIQKLDEADPEDMFAFTYDRQSWTPDFLQDAGRSRCEALFKKMYGASAALVRKNLVSVPWFGEKVQFTKVNHADDSLRAVAAELAKHPELKKYLKSSGTFYWRKVRGANRQSAHSYGMTIDIGVKYSDYWLWKNPGKKETDKITYANRFPHELVEIFERHGFIWGGRWYHYDTMHFEFRPEILKSAAMNNQ